MDTNRARHENVGVVVCCGVAEAKVTVAPANTANARHDGDIVPVDQQQRGMLRVVRVVHQRCSASASSSLLVPV